MEFGSLYFYFKTFLWTTFCRIYLFAASQEADFIKITTNTEREYIVEYLKITFSLLKWNLITVLRISKNSNFFSVYEFAHLDTRLPTNIWNIYVECNVICYHVPNFPSISLLVTCNVSMSIVFTLWIHQSIFRCACFWYIFYLSPVIF